MNGWKKKKKTFSFFCGLHDLCVLHSCSLVGSTGKKEGAVVSMMDKGSMLKRSRQDCR